MERIVLIIDDELPKPDEAKAFREKYPVPGFSYMFAFDYEEAKQRLLETDDICLILLCVGFGEKGDDYGLRILPDLIRVSNGTPIVMMSARTEPEILMRAWDLGAKGYIVKWDANPRFYEQLQEKVRQHSLPIKERTWIDKKRNRIKIRTKKLLKQYEDITVDDVIDKANSLREYLGVDWKYQIPFPEDFENYIHGWNATDKELSEAERYGKLLYLNMDFGTGCTLHCPHCFTQEGAIDERGRDPLPYNRLKEQILQAKEIGLKCVRILGRGEPTQWIWHPDNRVNVTMPQKGEDLIDFIQFLHNNEIIPLIFTRGQIIGDERLIHKFYDGAHDITSGRDLVRKFNEFGCSIFFGFSSFFPEIEDEMVGSIGHHVINRRALKILVDEGFNNSNPTRLAVEAPITNLNINDMLVRYVFFQLLNISPCSNVYMVTGRALTYGLGEITDPSNPEFYDMYACIAYMMRRMGIKNDLGPYAGTKECHDVSCGMYLTLNGDLYPCPGYEGVHNFVGSLQTNSIREIWNNNPYGRHPQSICPPKIATHFPPDFEEQIEYLIDNEKERYEETFRKICAGLSVDIRTVA